MISHYWFFNHGYKFQDSVCNGCHDLKMLNVNTSDIAIITYIYIDYYCIIHNVSYSKVSNILKSSVVEDCGCNIALNFSIFKTVFFFFFLLFLISVCKTVDCVYIYKHININIQTVIKNLEMLKAVSTYLKTKQMCNYAFKKLRFVRRCS